jgi:hypothetical protein
LHSTVFRVKILCVCRHVYIVCMYIVRLYFIYIYWEKSEKKINKRINAGDQEP